MAASTENLLILILNNIGTPGNIIIAIAILFIPYIIQILNWITRRSEHEKLKSATSSAIENTEKISKRNYEELKNDLNENSLAIVNNQEIIMRNLKAIAHLLQAVEYKMKGIISDEDSILMLKYFLDGFLFIKISEKCMIYSTKLTENPGMKMESEKQFILEMKNIWNEFIENMNDFSTHIKLGDFLKNLIKNEDFENNSIFSEIKTYVFDLSKTRLFQYEKIKALFNNFVSKCIQTLREKYKDYTKLRKMEE